MLALEISLFLLVHSGLSQEQRDGASEQLTEYKEKMTKPSVLTTAFGVRVPSLTASLTVGSRGPILLQDIVLLDEITHFDRERIPERVVHAKGTGAFGYFEVTHDITNYTKAVVFSKIGKKTSIAVRLSTVIGEKGSADTVREPRGYALKFQTEDGIWDLLGLHTPVFFIRDPILYPSLIHCQKKNPVTNLKDPDSFWDFLTLRPETVNQVMFLFSDDGIPDGYRHMDGHPINTFKLVNAEGEAFFCKFHYETNQKIKNLPPDVAEKIAGSDPDYASRDLYNAIHRGDYPSWTFYIQVMTEEEADRAPFNPFDATKIWPRYKFPYIPVGKIVLNQNPRNFFADVEQIAFSPERLIPGIEPSSDRTLQARLFMYGDTQRHRLGTNFLQLPINCPHRVHISNEQRDGPETFFNQGGTPNYYPNSFNGPRVDPAAAIKPFAVNGVANRYDSGDEDNFSQPRVFWRETLDAGGRSRLVKNIAENLRLARDFIQERAVKVFSEVDIEFGRRMQEALRSNATSRSNHSPHGEKEP